MHRHKFHRCFADLDGLSRNISILKIIPSCTFFTMLIMFPQRSADTMLPICGTDLYCISVGHCVKVSLCGWYWSLSFNNCRKRELWRDDNVIVGMTKHRKVRWLSFANGATFVGFTSVPYTVSVLHVISPRIVSGYHQYHHSIINFLSKRSMIRGCTSCNHLSSAFLLARHKRSPRRPLYSRRLGPCCTRMPTPEHSTVQRFLLCKWRLFLKRIISTVSTHSNNSVTESLSFLAPHL